MEHKVFITGIAGFIGFHLAQFLHQKKISVIGCDNFNSYYSVELKKKRASLLADLGIEILPLDILDPSPFKNLFQKHSFSHLVHLAAQPGVRYSLLHPHLYVQVNIQGFLNILELCRAFPHLKLIYASSSSVYGLNDPPFAENSPTDKPSNLYAATKKSNELMAHAYHHLYGISVTGLRFFTVYGPWGRPDMAYYLFAKSIQEGKPLELYNNGAMERDFTYISDVVQGIYHAIELGAPYELFNLGNHKPETLSTLIACLEKGLGKKALIKRMPMQKGELKTTCADLTHSEKVLHFHPKTSLQEGIQQFTHWFLTRPQGM